MDTAQERLPIDILPLSEITKANGEEGLKERLQAELTNVEWDIEAAQRVRDALEVALEAHQHDMRGEHPYSTHLLRVTIRIMSPGHFNIRDQPDLIVAALLHDVVEDHADYFTESKDADRDPIDAQINAIRYIQSRFGTSVAEYVAEMTNPPKDMGKTKDERRIDYQNHVIALLEKNNLAGIIKVSDFVDNCVGLIHNENPQKASNLARKYAPLLPHYREFVAHSPYFSNEVKQHLQTQIDRAETRCDEFSQLAA